jgi:Fe-S cluster assembly protein SufD
MTEQQHMKMPGAELAGRWAAALGAAEPGPAPTWLRELRAQAAGEFRAAGLPHRKVEAWKYTPMRAFENYELAAAAPALATAQAFEVPAPLCDRAIVVDIRDGVLMAPPAGLPDGLSVLPLGAGVERFEARLRRLYESVELQGATRAFAALNTALAQQGLVVHVKQDLDAGRLLLRWAFSPGAAATMSQFRVFLLLDDDAQLDLVEQFMSSWGGVEPTAAGLNLVCQAELGERATLRQTRVQAESDQALLLTAMTLEQAADSRYVFSGFDCGAALARHELNVRLAGPGAVAEIAGAFVLDGQRHTDNHVCVEHRAPNCSSEQFFRGVLGGRSRGVFNGRALIQPGADGSSVRQSNANLLLSPLAEIDTKPELEIYADEVEASHGATVGQLDETAVFYMRSRGLSEGEARRMLTGAFCRAVTDRVQGSGLSGRIAELLDAAMPGNEM